MLRKASLIKITEKQPGKENSQYVSKYTSDLRSGKRRRMWLLAFCCKFYNNIFYKGIRVKYR